MKVLLEENVENLGVKGEIKDVAPGYFYNYLFPNDLAKKATDKIIKQARERQEQVKKERKKLKKKAQELKGKVNGKELVIEKAADNEVLYAQLKPDEISQAINDKFDLEGGDKLEPEMIILNEPVKNAGEVTVPIKLFEDIKAEIKLIVKPKEVEPGSSEKE